MNSPAKDYDIVILGGAFSGASAAVLLRRDRPELSVLVIERLEAFDAKVGEATTEMSGMFLTRRLALWQHLEREHLGKDGLRYWFRNEKVANHAQASESGPWYRSTVPSFQLRRDVLDEHILATAVARRFALDVEPASVEPAGTPPGLRHGRGTLLRPPGDGEGPEDPVRERSRQAMWNPPAQVPAEATGIVVDLEGRPVAGARVVVGGADAEADGLTGADGTFRIELHDHSYRMLDLEVTAPGFDRWAFTAFYGGVQAERISSSRGR